MLGTVVTTREPISGWAESADNLGEEVQLRRAADDAAVEPWALLKAVRDSSGRVVDFVCHDINRVGARQQGLRREDLLGRSVAESLPKLDRNGVLDSCVHCIDTGEPLILDDLAYDGRTRDGAEAHTRRYEIRGVRVDSDYLSVNWRDVNQRYLTQQKVSESEERYRLLAENSSDVVSHVRDGKFIWVSPSVEKVLGAPPEYWLGRPVSEIIPPGDVAAHAVRWQALSRGDSIQQRVQVVSVDGVAHWVHLHAKPFHDVNGHPDCAAASFRVVDAEVAAQREAESALVQQAATNALYREVMGSAAVGMCITSPEGVFEDVNAALCEFFGYDADTLCTKSWQEVTAAEYLANDLAKVEDMLAGHLDRYRTTKQFINAGGDRIWGDLSVSCLRGPAGGVQKFIAQVVDVNAEVEERERAETALRLLAASADSMLDPQMLLEGVRDPAGRVVDLRYREANDAACTDMAMTRDELIGKTVLELLPGFAESGPLSNYIQCLETGQPGALNDYSYDNEIHAESRRYDIRISPAGEDLISLTFRDVTERFQAAQRAAEAQILLHATVDSMLNPQSLLEAVRDNAGQVVDFTYRSANRALCSQRGREEHDIIGGSVLEAQPGLLSSGLFAHYVHCVDTGEAVVLDDATMSDSVLGDDRRFDIRAVRAGVDLISLTFDDVTERYRAAKRIAESERTYRLLAENAGDLVVHARDGRFAWVSPAFTDVIGGSLDYWVGRDATEIVLPEEGQLIIDSTEAAESGGVVQLRHRVQAMDGTIHWVHVHAKPFYGPDGREDGITAAMRVIDDEVAAEQQAEEARRQRARADALFRRSVDSAAIGMCLINAEGGFIEVNEAACAFFGYDAETLKSRTWHDLTAEEYLQADTEKVADVLAARIDSYRMTKKYIHADGHPIWGDLSVSCLRDDKGQFEVFISQITDITATVEANERNRVLTDRMTAELDSAAAYMASIMPTGLSGTVDVSSRYLPSRELGGDCLGYTWLDDDHLQVYLIDISGHGIEPALLSVSVHNMLRSGSLAPQILVEPQTVVAELNRLFQMESQNDHYFTIWYGVYQASTRTLRYTSAGAPPAFAFNSRPEGGRELTELATRSAPVGMFETTEFASDSYAVPHGCRILIHSDGASELTLDGDRQLSPEQFMGIASRVVGSSDDSLDQLIEELRSLTSAGTFEDDCSVIELAFD